MQQFEADHLLGEFRRRQRRSTKNQKLFEISNLKTYMTN